MERTLRLLSVVAPVFDEEALVEAFYARVCAALEGSRSSWCSSTTDRATARPRCSPRSPPHDPRVRVDPRCRATSATRRRSPPGSTTRAATRSSMLDADLQDPPELIPDDARALARGHGRRLRGAPPTRGRDALQAHDRALVLQALRRDRRRRRSTPNSGDFRLLDRARARRAAVDARAQPLPARDDGVGRLHADGRPVRARRAPRRRDEVHAAQDAAASRSTRSRRSRTGRCSSRRCSASSARLSRSCRSRS